MFKSKYQMKIIFQGESNNLSEEKLVLTKKSNLYPLVRKPLSISLILSVATAIVKKVFSTMSSIHDRLRNRMSDEWMNDSAIVCVEYF